MTIGIYCITNKINGKQYIGQSLNIEKRWKQHTSKRTKKFSTIKNAINKYGENNFLFQILVECEKEYLNECEIEYIKFYDTLTPNGYNVTAGGDGMYGYKASEETRLKMSLLRKGEKNHFYGKKHSDEMKEKMSKIKKESGSSVGEKNGMYGKPSAMRGKNHTDEAKEKMSKALSKPKEVMRCEYCGMIGGIANIKRYHYSQECRFKNIINMSGILSLTSV